MRRYTSLWSAGLVWVSTCGAVGTPAPPPTPAVLTTADFARKPQYLDAKISPDGRYLAVIFPKDDVVALAFIDIQSLKITGSLRFSHGQDVADVWWASADRAVVAVAKSFGPLDQKSLTGELYGINADGSQKTYLHGYQGSNSAGTHIAAARQEYSAAYMVEPITQEADHALIAIQSWRNQTPGYELALLDVNNGSKRHVSSLPADYLPDRKSVVTDAAGRPRYALGYLADGSTNQYLHDLEKQTWKLVQSSDKTVHVRLVGMNEEANLVYLISNEGSDRSCLRSRDLVSLEVKTLSCNAKVDVAEIPVRGGGGRPVAVGYEDGLPSAEVLEGTSLAARAYRTLLKSFPGQRVDVTSNTADGKKLVVRVDSDRNPGDYYLFDLMRVKAEYLFSSRPWIDPQAMSPSTPIEVKARDGRVLAGYLTSSGGLKAEHRPLVIMPHGGPHGIRDVWAWDAWPQYLASLGYAVLQVNYRGSGGYGGTFLYDGYRHWGTLMQDDLTDSVKWAIDAGIADRSRVCIMGASYGGYAAMMSAVKEPDLYRCAIAMAGVYDLATQSRDSDTANSVLGREYLREALGANPEELKLNSPITYVERLKVPVLIAHGTADERVPFSQAKELRKELDRLHKPYEWMEFSGEEHGFYLEADHVRFLDAVKVFLAVNMVAPSPATDEKASMNSAPP